MWQICRQQCGASTSSRDTEREREMERVVLMMRSFEHLLPLGSARKFFSLVELMMSVHSSLRSLFRQGDAPSDAMLHTLRREATQKGRQLAFPPSIYACHSGNKSSTKQPA